MRKEELIEEIFTVDFDDCCILALVMNESGNYIEENSKNFVTSAINMFSVDNVELKYDYAEIKNMEYPELVKVRYENGLYFIEVKIGYSLDLWNQRNFIGDICAYAKGVFSFKLNGFWSHEDKLIPLEKVDATELKHLKQNIEDFMIHEIKNEEEYFDTYID